MASIFDFLSTVYLDLNPEAECYQDAAGTNVAELGDVVGNTAVSPSVRVTQSNTSKKPTLLQDALGWKYFSFDGVDDQLANALFAGPGAIPFELTCVEQIITGSGTGIILAISSGRFAKNNQGRYFTHFGNAYVVSGGIAGKHVLSTLVDGAASMISIDDVAQPGSGDSGSAVATPNMLTIGTSITSGEACQMDVWRMLVHNRLSPANRSGLIAHLLDLYGNPRPEGFPLSFTHHHLQMMGAR